MEAGVPPAAPPPAATAAATGSYPVRFDVEYTEPQSRLTTFFRLILAIPQLIVLSILGIIAVVITLIAWFAILFTARYPRGMFDFVVNYYRWRQNVITYLILARGEYPPFSWDAGRYPVEFEVDFADRRSRLSTFFRLFLAIPQMLIVQYGLGYLFAFLGLFQWIYILVTGKTSRNLFDMLVGVARWDVRYYGYVSLLTDRYPPFTIEKQ